MTDTFHGTIFSAISHTPFASFVRSSGYGNSEKLTDLLSRLGLTSRAATGAGELVATLDAPVDWAATDAVVRAGREAARDYLKKEVSACTRS